VKRITKKNALSLIHNQIIIEAKSMLTQTNIPIKVIASNLGFKEPSHFNNFFKKRIDLTPSAYRKRGLL